MTRPEDIILTEIQAKYGVEHRLFRNVVSGVYVGKRVGGKIGGTITLADLSEDTLDGSSDGLLNANDVARHHPPVAEANGGIDQALRLMRDSGEEYVAVVETRDAKTWRGVTARPN